MIYDNLVAKEFGRRPTFATSGLLLVLQTLFQNITVFIIRVSLTAVAGCVVLVSGKCF